MKDYEEIIKPLVASRPDVFGSSDYYSEDLYNHMGSLILSRSFHVEDPEDEDDEQEGNETKEQESNEADESNASLLEAAEGMDIHNDNGHIDEDGESDDDDEDDQEEVNHIAMVPWADMLNARHECDNARLFYEKECLNMTTTKPIKKGEQIVSTYTYYARDTADLLNCSGMYMETRQTLTCFGGMGMLMTAIQQM